MFACMFDCFEQRVHGCHHSIRETNLARILAVLRERIYCLSSRSRRRFPFPRFRSAWCGPGPKCVAGSKKCGRHSFPKSPLCVHGPRLRAFCKGRSKMPAEQPRAHDHRNGDIQILCNLHKRMRIPLPRKQCDWSRRIPVAGLTDLPLVAVTMRGDFYFVHSKQKQVSVGFPII